MAVLYSQRDHRRVSFPGMSKQDLQGLKDASWNMDFGKGQQDPAMSYEHGMSDGTTNQDPMVAQQMGDNFISQLVQTAQQAQADWEAQGHTGIALVPSRPSAMLSTLPLIGRRLRTEAISHGTTILGTTSGLEPTLREKPPSTLLTRGRLIMRLGSSSKGPSGMSSTGCSRRHLVPVRA